MPMILIDATPGTATADIDDAGCENGTRFSCRNRTGESMLVKRIRTKIYMQCTFALWGMMIKIWGRKLVP